MALEPYLDAAVGIHDGRGSIGKVKKLIQPFLALVDPALLEGYSLASPRLPELLAGLSTHQRINDGNVHTALPFSGPQVRSDQGLLSTSKW